MSQPILVVDDDEVLGRVLGRVLSRQGYGVLRATTVAQALDAATEAPPQLALVDLCLPDGDGVQLARVLRTHHPELPVILMTAYSVRLQDNPAWTTDCFCLLTKPLNVGDLRRAVKAALAPGGDVAPWRASTPWSSGCRGATRHASVKES